MKDVEVLVTVTISASWIGEWKAELQCRSRIDGADEYLLHAAHGRWSQSEATTIITEADARSVLGALLAARIPAAVEPRRGLDGRTTSVEWGTEWGGARYVWWSQPNDAWRPLQDIAERIIALSPIPVPTGGP